MFRSSPFTLTDNRQARAVDDEMKSCAPWNAPQRQVEVLATAGQRRVIRRPQVEPHQHEERREEALGLTERQMEEKTERQGGFDREVRVLPLRAPRARSVWFPGGDGRRGQPDGDVASTDQGAITGGPVLDVVLRLVRGMDSRLHPSSLVCPLGTSNRIRAPTPCPHEKSIGFDTYPRDIAARPTRWTASTNAAVLRSSCFSRATAVTDLYAFCIVRASSSRTCSTSHLNC